MKPPQVIGSSLSVSSLLLAGALQGFRQESFLVLPVDYRELLWNLSPAC